MAAEMPLPKRIVVHSHWLVDHRKMSKSLDNVVDPRRIIDKVSVDGLRYFRLAEATPDQDNNFSEKVCVLAGFPSNHFEIDTRIFWN